MVENGKALLLWVGLVCAVVAGVIGAAEHNWRLVLLGVLVALLASTVLSPSAVGRLKRMEKLLTGQPLHSRHDLTEYWQCPSTISHKRLCNGLAHVNDRGNITWRDHYLVPARPWWLRNDRAQRGVAGPASHAPVRPGESLIRPSVLRERMAAPVLGELGP
jgi:hypothetical protein